MELPAEASGGALLPRFFTDTAGMSAGGGDRLYISGEDARHIAKVLRVRPGDRLTLCNGAGTDFLCEVTSVSPDKTECRVLEAKPSVSEPGVRVTIYAAVTKGDRMDFLIQKAVELGVFRIVPVITGRCVFVPDEKSRKNRLKRWNRIAYEASKQSGRGIIPEVGDFIGFKDAVGEAAGAELALIAYEREESPLRMALESCRFGEVSLLTGPEGGFEEREVELATAAGMVPVSLGKRILRAETAPLAALAAIMYSSGNM